MRENNLANAKIYSGNFGDVLAGFFAKKLGVPSESLVIATNENDILHRFWQTGAYGTSFRNNFSSFAAPSLEPQDY